MIPTLILFGLLFGRWWRSVLIVAAVGWPVLLLATGAVSAVGADLIPDAGLAVINAGVGVAINQGGHWSLRKFRHTRARKAPGLGEPSPSDQDLPGG